LVRGIKALNRRHLESYLYDDEILTALCIQENKPSEVSGLLQDKADALQEMAAQGKPIDDMKSAAGLVFVEAKRRLGLTGKGNDQKAFARNVLAPLVTPSTSVYKELRTAIFGH
jgi:hypothetical protein